MNATNPDPTDVSAPCSWLSQLERVLMDIANRAAALGIWVVVVRVVLGLFEKKFSIAGVLPLVASGLGAIALLCGFGAFLIARKLSRPTREALGVAIAGLVVTAIASIWMLLPICLPRN